jgi:phosphatidylethanolamine-binding protein (PEBP) family uncharacterized protein
MPRICVTLALLLALSNVAGVGWAHPGHDDDHEHAAGTRHWTDAKGIFELDATFVSSKAGKVQLRKKDGKLVTLSISELSEGDQKWIKDRLAEIRNLNEQQPTTNGREAAKNPSQESKAPEIERAFEPFAKLKAIKYRSDDRYFYVESNGMPDHPMMIGITAWQQQVPLPQKYVGDNAWRIPLHPVAAKEPASANGRFLRGAIALAVNGIPIFNPLNNRGDDAFLFGELDEYGGHCGRADDYHYHIAPVHLEKQVGKGSIIAYALDGYPIYGYDEADGAKAGKLDPLNGHKDADGHYHYHASKTYPYLNGGFYGDVTEVDGQVDPQPRAQPVREALPPLRGAKIVDFTSPKPNSYNLTYDVAGRQGHVNYTIEANGSLAFTFIDTAGNNSNETYTPRGQGPGGKGARPPRKPGTNPPPRDGQRPPPQDDQPARYQSKSNLPQLTVTSSSVDKDGFISKECTCDGESTSPAVEWSGAPEATKYFAVSLWHIAPDREKSYWVIYNIPAKTTKLPKSAQDIGIMGMNDKGRAEFDPMCSKGPGVKEYHITVYALSAEVKLSPDDADRPNLLAAIKDLTLAEGTLDFKYERQQQNGPGGQPMGGPGARKQGGPGAPPRGPGGKRPMEKKS